jgi:mannose-6-phosphate isomerase-like protein (cupin superfamily)
MTDPTGPNGFQIFRFADAPSLMEAGCMSVEPFSPVQRAGFDLLREAGNLDGDEIKVLVNLPGFSITYAWLKQGYALPLHSHDADCLYYVVAGSLKLGTEELKARDSFFVPAHTPYTYKPGQDGVEVVEFRHAQQFSFLALAKGETYWRKAAELAAHHHPAWTGSPRPSES